MLQFDKSKFKSETNNGVITLTYEDKDIFKNGTDIPLETIENVEKYRSSYIKSVTEEAAERAKDALLANESATRVFVNFPFSSSKKGMVSVKVDKEKHFRGINGHPDTSKSKIDTIVLDPLEKVSKSTIKALEDELTSILLK